MDEAFQAAKLTLSWLQQVVENLGNDLAAVAMERLPPTLFPPTQLREVLREVRAALPHGWSLAPSLQAGNLWRTYKDARVAAAASPLGLRICIHLPVFEFTLSFLLFRVTSLPRAVGNGTLADRFHPLSDYLAVSMDRQNYSYALLLAGLVDCALLVGAVLYFSQRRLQQRILRLELRMELHERDVDGAAHAEQPPPHVVRTMTQCLWRCWSRGRQHSIFALFPFLTFSRSLPHVFNRSGRIVYLLLCRGLGIVKYHNRDDCEGKREDVTHGSQDVRRTSRMARPSHKSTGQSSGRTIDSLTPRQGMSRRYKAALSTDFLCLSFSLCIDYNPNTRFVTIL